MSRYVRNARTALVGAMIVLAGTAARASAQGARLVEVDGRRLEVVKRGEGHPVVLLEAGVGADWRQWSSVIDSVAQTTTVVAYSRAGYGRSDPAPGVRSPLEIAAELQALLRAVDAPGPYLLVGHSFGGLLMRVFAAQHPTDTVGVLLVDPTHERQVLEWDERSPGLMRQFGSQLERLRKGTHNAVLKETEAMWPIMQSGELSDAHPFPQVPLVVLTSMRVGPTNAGFPFSPEGRGVWRDLHASLIAGMDRGAQIVTAKSGHNIQLDEPQLVVDSIRLLLEWAR